MIVSKTAHKNLMFMCSFRNNHSTFKNLQKTNVA